MTRDRNRMTHAEFPFSPSPGAGREGSKHKAGAN